MACLTKRQTAQELGCLPEDVDAIMSYHTSGPMGAVNGVGGWYFDGIVKLVKDYMVYRAQLELKLHNAIQQYLASSPEAEHSFLCRQLAMSVDMSSPQSVHEVIERGAMYQGGSSYET